MLKQDAIIEYLNKLHERYALVPKLYKNPVGSRFIIASKNLFNSQIENFHRKSKFLSNYNKFWVLQNVAPVTGNINIINRKKNAKSIASYDFSILYTTLPHDKLINRLCNVIDFVFECGNRTNICISKNNVACWGKTPEDNIAFSKDTLKTALKQLIQNFYGWKFTAKTQNRYTNGNWLSSILGKSLFIHL